MSERSGDPADLESVRTVFEELGRDDPMYAALSRNAFRNNRWDQEAFFETGRREIADVLASVEALGITVQRGHALDFGCAVGRLTQALADHFAEVTGIDIASAMIERARDYNRHGERVRYIANPAADLRVLDTDSCDFVYSNKVLQHIPPDHQLGYIREFVRVLRPGGLAVFQMRNGPVVRPGTTRALLYTMNRKYFRRFAQRIRGRPAYEMHYVARCRVESTVSAAGGRTAAVTDLSRGKPNKSLRYYVVK